MTTQYRKKPAIGFAERSRGTRKLSVALPIAHMDAIRSEAERRRISAAQVVREAISERYAPEDAE